MANNTTTEFSTAIDGVMGTITFFCFLVGVPSNVFAIVFFYKDQKANTRNVKKLFFTEQYLTMAVVDVLITITIFPLIEVYWNGRISVLFDNKVFCVAWGFLWEMLPYFSVFLVGILSISRMIVLVKPMTTLNIVTLRVCTGSYFVFHLIFRMSLLLFDVIKFRNTPKPGYPKLRFSYTNRSAYCYFYAHEDVLWTVNSFFQCILLGLPMIPILVSFGASLCKLKKTSGGPNFNRDAQKHATVTIIIVTVVYICCNVPVFVNYITYSAVLIKDLTSTIHDPSDYYHYYQQYSENKDIFWAWYIWSLTYVICAVINAAINPIIFFWRMKPFRKFITGLIPCNVSFQNTKAAMTGVSVKELTSSSFWMKNVYTLQFCCKNICTIILWIFAY